MIIEIIVMVSNNCDINYLHSLQEKLHFMKLCKAWRLQRLAKHINSKYEIKPCPNNVGVQQSLCSKLKEWTHDMLQKQTIRVTSYRVTVPKFAEN